MRNFKNLRTCLKRNNKWIMHQMFQACNMFKNTGLGKLLEIIVTGNALNHLANHIKKNRWDI